MDFIGEHPCCAGCGCRTCVVLAPEVIATAKAQRWQPAEVLRILPAAGVADRAAPRWPRAASGARVPPGRHSTPGMSACPRSLPPPGCAAHPGMDRPTREPRRLRPVRHGKTFMLEALGQAVVESGRNVAWFTLEQVGALLRRHKANDSVRVRKVQAGLDGLDDRAVAALCREPFRAKPPVMTLLCGLTENFHAQARINALALHLGLPSLCAQVWREGRGGAEITFTYPSVTSACHRCILASHYTEHSSLTAT